MNKIIKLSEIFSKLSQRKFASLIDSISEVPVLEQRQEEEEQWQAERQGVPSFFTENIKQGDKTFFSSIPFTEFRSVEQSPPTMLKPKGLWYQCDLDWILFAHEEIPHVFGSYKYLYKITPNYSSMVVIDSEDKIELFHEKFSVQKNSSIDWRAVANQYTGIEICPYRDSKRMEYDWYYPWDAASGCIWDQSAIQNIELIAENKDGSWEKS